MSTPALSVALARTTLIQTVGKVASVALGWAAVLLMTNGLGAERFGAYTVMVVYLQLFAVAADFGMVLVSSQLLAEQAGRAREVFANLLGFRAASAAVALLLAPVAIWLFPYGSDVKAGVVVLTGAFFLTALLQIFTGLFQKELAMGRALFAELAGRVVLLGAVVVALASARGLPLIVWGVVASNLVNVALAALFARRFVPLSLAADWAAWREIWRRAWPLATGIVFNLVYLKADIIILSLTRPLGEVGVYGALYRVLEVLIIFPTMFAGLLVPLLSAAWARGDTVEFRRVAQQSLDAVLFLAWPLVVGVGFIAPRLAALFGPEFSNAGPLLWLLVLATSVIFVGTFFGHLIVAAHRQRAMLIFYALTAAVGLAGYLVVIPRYGAFGAAGMTVVAELLVASLGYVVLRRTVGVALSLRRLGVAVAASAPMALWLWFGSSLPLPALILGAAALYAAALWWLGVLTADFLRRVFTRGLSS